MRMPRRAWHFDVAGGAICVALAVGGYCLVYLPVKQQRIDLEQVREELTIQQESARKLTLTNEMLQGQLRRARRELAEGSVELHPIERFNRRLAVITELVETAGMTIDQTEHGEPRAGRYYQTVPVRVTGLGTYSQCAAFMHELNASAPDVGIAAFELSGNPAAPNTPAEIALDLQWYAAPSMTATSE